MSIVVHTLTSASYRHSIMVDGRHELATDLPISAGGQGSAPEPHDYFDTALATCKALTVTHYARQYEIPLTGITVEVSRDSSQEKEGLYTLSVELTLRGALTDDQRSTLLRVAERCPLHRLMTETRISIESRLAEGPFSE